MRIIIAGGSGFIGQALVSHFVEKGHELIIIGRDKNRIKSIFANQLETIDWEDFDQSGKDIILGSDLIINLAGANIAEKRWTPKRKAEIIESRVLTTQKLVNYCMKLENHSPPLFNASAVGIYGLQKPISGKLPKSLSEDDPIDFDHANDFVSQIVKAWEKATHPAIKSNVRVVNMRFSPVLAKKGLLAKLKPSYLLGLGGPIGSGEQPFPWIALADLINAIDFLISKPQIRGPVNFVSPECISQQEFARAFAHALHRPSIIKTPAFLVKGIFGEMAEELLLNGQCAYPKVLLENGFTFKYTDIRTTLDTIFK